MPRLLNMLMGRAALLMSPDIDDTANGIAYEKQFSGDDPDDSDTPGANNDGTQNVGDAPAPAPAPAAAPAAPAAPAVAPAPPAPAAPPAGDGSDPLEEPDPAAAAAAAAAQAAAPAVPAAAPVADAGAAPAAAPAAAPGAAEFVPWTPPEPEPVRLAPPDAAAQLEAAKAERAAALQQYRDGDIEDDKFQEIQERTIATETTLQSQIAADSMADNARREAATVQFRGLFAESVNELQRAGIAATDENVDEFGELVTFYGGKAAAKGMKDGAGLVASRWALKEATRIFALDRGKAAPAPAPAAAPAAPAAAPAAKVPTKAEADAARALDRSNLPPTLAQAPLAGDASVTNNDRFAAVDALEGVAQERAIAAMTPAEEAAYLNR